MREASRLGELSRQLGQAVTSQDWQLAHAIADERLALLRSLCAAGDFPDALVHEAAVVLAQEGVLTAAIDAQRSEVLHQLQQLMAAEKAAQRYKTHSR